MIILWGGAQSRGHKNQLAHGRFLGSVYMEDDFPLPEGWGFELTSNQQLIEPTDESIITFFDSGENIYVKMHAHSIPRIQRIIAWRLLLSAFMILEPTLGDTMFPVPVIENTDLDYKQFKMIKFTRSPFKFVLCENNVWIHDTA